MPMKSPYYKPGSKKKAAKKKAAKRKAAKSKVAGVNKNQLKQLKSMGYVK
jgi:hypothetical protein